MATPPEIDHQVVAALYQFRMATAEQLRILHTPDSQPELMRRRLRQLRDEGLVEDVVLPLTMPPAPTGAPGPACPESGPGQRPQGTRGRRHLHGRRPRTMPLSSTRTHAPDTRELAPCEP
ncbi:hypothetical protein P3T35_003919 [Kitasatospora sp. GP30]|uniref:hypothetical protein n=1 Tax=Kitasatospora sp. GP30 TaxID=3035084 RepID=UPI000CBAE986|nr:hypothetical protein [Kitasatospora sp. GP30]MDH6141898.1 hypothetical protein [Kitasatospora sp. GP30]